jgi:hypothetical protein
MNTNRDRGQDHAANDNGGSAVVPVPAAGALTSLAALATALNSVDTSIVAGRSGLPMLSFKREGSGTWAFGQKRTVPEEGSSWAVNPASFKWGFVAFNDNKVVGERLVPVSQPRPDVTQLPDVGAKWNEQWAAHMKCTDGVDAGTEVVFKPTTDGGIKAVVGLIEAVRDRLNDNQHDGKVVPIVCLKKDSYQHAQFGRVWLPVLPITGWMPLDGSAPGPKPASPPPVEQPRRRRVA